MTVIYVTQVSFNFVGNIETEFGMPRAVAQNNLGARMIPLYDKDGKTVIGKFKIGSGRVEYFTDDKN
jgi:hypothetical protein